MNWRLTVLDKQEPPQTWELDGPAEIGRRKPEEASRETKEWDDGHWRVIIAPLEERSVPRRCLLISPLAGDRFRIENKSDQTINLPNRQVLKDESCEVLAPVQVRIGTKTVKFQMDDESVHSLPSETMAPGGAISLDSLRSTFDVSGLAIKVKSVSAWVQVFLELLHSAAGSQDFFAKAARAMVELVRLSSGRVLIRSGDDAWETRALHGDRLTSGAAGWQPSKRVLASLVKDKKTVWELPKAGGSASESVSGLDAVVAAPILDRNANVIGALYGERRIGDAHSHHPITEIDARFVEVLAMGVAAGLSRLEQEGARLKLEGFFGRKLATKIIGHQELLKGRNAQVSVLFCDIRAFSRISEKLGPVVTIDLVASVMDALSSCVLDHDGVIVDYIGDELMAMWGAPDDQPDHPRLACQAALAMRECLPSLRSQWNATLAEHELESLDIGIGINSGPAQVGNTGSQVKFKYGPLGNSVNLASRVQGATKHLKTPVLITESTQKGLADQLATRRLCQVRMVNIESPVTLYELTNPQGPGWLDLKSSYEEALDHFEGKNAAGTCDFRAACRILGRLIPDHRDDGPALNLLRRAVAALADGPDPEHPVWRLSEK